MTNLSNKAFLALLDERAKKACPEAVEWITRRGGDTRQMWEDCPVPEWLLAAVPPDAVPPRTWVQIVVEIARLALPFVPKDDDAPRRAIESAEKWLQGKATAE